MNPPQAGFYVTGGTLRGDASCYVPRRADADLYEGLEAAASSAMSSPLDRWESPR